MGNKLKRSTIVSNTFNVDLGLEIGKAENLNDENLTYMKLKIGKGKEESMALRSIVENGTGKTLNDCDHYVSIKIPKNVNADELKETIEGLTEEGLIEEIDGKGDEKWLMISLKKYNDSAETVASEDFEKMQKDIDDFFANAKAHSYIEISVRTPRNFVEAEKIARDQNELENESILENWPSFMNFLKD